MSLAQYVGTLNLLGDESRIRLVRAPARAGAQRDGPRPRDRHLAVARVDAPGAAPRRRASSGIAATGSTRSISSP